MSAEFIAVKDAISYSYAPGESIEALGQGYLLHRGDAVTTLEHPGKNECTDLSMRGL